MSRERKHIIIRFAILAPMLIAMAIMIRPITARAWTWYKPWTWPIVENAYYTVKDIFIDPSEECPPDDQLMARVMVDGEEGSRDFYSQTAIAWNYAVARAVTGKKVIVKLEASWRGRDRGMRTQYPSPVEGGSGSDRAWLILHKYDMGADMRYKDIPYLNSTSKDYVDAFQDGGILVPEGCDITIDLNGQTINRKADFEYIDDGEVIHVKKGAKLTIIDSDPDKYNEGNSYRGGYIQGGSSTNGAGAIQIKNGAKVYIEGGTFFQNSSSDDGGAIKIDGEDAELHIDGTTFVGNCSRTAVIKSNYGGAIAGFSSTIDIRNAVFEKNIADDRGGAVYNDSCKLNMINCEFTGNSTEGDGGALYLGSSRDDPRMLINKIACSYNKADEGGAIYFNTDGAADVFDSRIIYGTAYRGGGIYVNKKGVCLINSKVTDNVATDKAGGIYVDSIADLNLAGEVCVEENTATIDHSVRNSNVVLQDGNASRALINNGGLTEGSRIGVSSTKSKLDNIPVCSNLSDFAAKYFISDESGYRLAIRDGQYETGSYVASMVGGNTVALIVLLSVVAVAGIVLTFIVIRRRKAKMISGDQL